MSISVFCNKFRHASLDFLIRTKFADSFFYLIPISFLFFFFIRNNALNICHIFRISENPKLLICTYHCCSLNIFARILSPRMARRYHHACTGWEKQYIVFFLQLGAKKIRVFFTVLLGNVTVIVAARGSTF